MNWAEETIHNRLKILLKEYNYLHNSLFEGLGGRDLRKYELLREITYNKISDCYKKINICKKSLLIYHIIKPLPLPNAIILKISTEMLTRPLL